MDISLGCIWLIARSELDPDRYRREQIDDDHGWFPTEEAAQRKADELNAHLRTRYEQYRRGVRRNNAAKREWFERAVGDYEVLTKAGRAAQAPVEPTSELPRTFESWSSESTVFVPHKVEAGTQQPKTHIQTGPGEQCLNVDR